VAWRLAGSLVVLRNQINAAAPHRSKASDGTIGDAAHGARASRHNPNDHDVVTAIDITHDPARGCDIHAIADHIRQHPHPELAYIISLGRIAGRATSWAWHRYTGSNPHNIHAHFGVGQGSDSDPRPPYDSTAPWAVPGPAPGPARPPAPPPPVPIDTRGDPGMDGIFQQGLVHFYFVDHRGALMERWGKLENPKNLVEILPPGWCATGPDARVKVVDVAAGTDAYGYAVGVLRADKDAVNYVWWTGDRWVKHGWPS
jgi:hypothetical protein